MVLIVRIKMSSGLPATIYDQIAHQYEWCMAYPFYIQIDDQDIQIRSMRKL